MEVKKKLINFLNTRGIALKLVILLMLVLGLQMIFCSICYAGVSYDYVDYSINLFADNYTDTTNSQLTQNYRTCFSNFDTAAKNYIVTRVNQFLSDKGLSNLTDVNIVFYVKPLSLSQIGLCVCVFNNGAPNAVSNLDHFLYVENQSIGNGFLPYSNNSNDYIYQFRMVYNIVNNGPYFDTTYNWNFNNSSLLPLSYYSSSLSNDNTFLTLTNIACAFIPAGFCFYPVGTTQSTIPVILRDVLGNYNYPAEPEQPSGDNGSGDNPSNNSGLGNITNSSGDNAGNINLLPIEQGITNLTNQISGDSQRIIDNQTQNTQTIVNTISGETQKITNTLTESAENTIENTVITSGDIANTVDFSPINNSQEYTAISNLWYELLMSFSNALTNVNRSINIEFRGQFYTINLDDFTLNVPALLKVFLASFTTAVVIIYISKNIKHIIEDIQTASIDNVANKLTEDFETNLF